MKKSDTLHAHAFGRIIFTTSMDEKTQFFIICLYAHHYSLELRQVRLYRFTFHQKGWPSRLLQSIHIHFNGPLHRVMWLVIIGAHSTWPEVLPFQSTTTLTTIDRLRTVFTHKYRLQFTATQLKEFLRKRRHPSSHIGPQQLPTQ